VEFVDRFKGQRSRSHRLTSANAVKVVGETSSRVRHVDQKHVQNPHRRPQINITTTNQWIAGNARRFSNAFRVPVYHTDHAHCLEMNARLSRYGQNVPETGETAQCPISATPHHAARSVLVLPRRISCTLFPSFRYRQFSFTAQLASIFGCLARKESVESVVSRLAVSNRERKCADTISTVLVPWTGHLQC